MLLSAWQALPLQCPPGLCGLQALMVLTPPAPSFLRQPRWNFEPSEPMSSIAKCRLTSKAATTSFDCEAATPRRPTPMQIGPAATSWVTSQCGVVMGRCSTATTRANRQGGAWGSNELDEDFQSRLVGRQFKRTQSAISGPSRTAASVNGDG